MHDKTKTDCVLFNDTTSQLNWGCHATTHFTIEIIKKNFNIKKNLTLHDSLIKNKLDQFIEFIKQNDINYIFVNGEGSLYEQKDLKGKSMINFMIKIKKLDKILYLVNSGYDLKSETNIKLFQETFFDNIRIQLREPISVENFKRHYPNQKYIFQPDFLLTINKNDYSSDILDKYKLVKQNYIVIGGNSNYYRSDRPNYDAIKVYCKLINKIKLIVKKKIIIYAASAEEIGWLSKISKKTECKLISVKNTSWKDGFVILSNSYLSISGRYHPSLMSLIGGVPSLCISANHCKMNGINKMFKQPWKVINSHLIHENIPYIINFIKKLSDKEFYQKMKNDLINNYNELKQISSLKID